MTQRIIIIGGAYGSGKTEFSIAYARQKNAEGLHVGLVDLDIVNPYFRSRDQTEELAGEGIEIVSSEPGLENSDIPAISPKIYGILQDLTYESVIFDVGGDPVGARALGRFRPYFKEGYYDFWMVVNPYRPGTRNLKEAVKLISDLQSACRLHVTGLISNINLGPQTTLEVWTEGLPLIENLTKELHVPLLHHMVTRTFYLQHSEFLQKYPIYEISLQMRPEWLDQ